MCEFLNISRSTIYYNSTINSCDSELENEVIDIIERIKDNVEAIKII